VISLRHKIGQMLIMGFSGCDVDEHSPVVKWLKDDGLGGVLLFDFDMTTQCYGKNLRDREQIQRLTHQLNDYANHNHSTDENRLPLFIAVDYEGGAVDRLTKINGCMKTIQACEQALLSDKALYQEAEKMAVTLQDLGFNLNFAPVVDLNLNEKQGIIGKLGRSFSADPGEVVRAAKQIVTAFAQYEIVCAYKHFPGHGSAFGDTHEGFVDVTECYHPNELVPYTMLFNDISLPPAMVMTAHVVNRQLDASGLPATLSSLIITNLLRHEMGFEGVVVSDDLQMQAISNHYSLDEALRLTINAGADMVIFGNQLGDNTATEIIDHIEQLVESGAIERARIEHAYERISHLKQHIVR
jgi:beta-N-acetylhexosaminidase